MNFGENRKGFENFTARRIAVAVPDFDADAEQSAMNGTAYVTGLKPSLLNYYA